MFFLSLLFLFFFFIHTLASPGLSTQREQEDFIGDPASLYCDSIVGYFVGRFQPRNFGTPAFSAQFLLRLRVDQEKISILVEGWNEQLARSGDFSLNFGNNSWCRIEDQSCSLTLPQGPTNFLLDLSQEGGPSFHLLRLEYSNSSFGLVETVGRCAKNQLSGLDDDRIPDLAKLSLCVCCQRYEPEEVLGCSVKGDLTWSPSITTNIILTKRRTNKIVCSTAIGHWSGSFRNMFRPLAVEMEFQIRLSNVDGDIHLRVTYWNETKMKSSNVFLMLHTNEAASYCGQISNVSCSVPCSSKLWISTRVEVEGDWNQFSLPLFSSLFNNRFIFNAADQCTDWYLSDPDLYSPDTSLYQSCLCCEQSYRCPLKSVDCLLK